jgi:alpha-L-fucosidase
MRTNGEAIYATEAGPITPLPSWGRTTLKTDASGATTLYVHVWNWPADGKLLLPGIKQPALSGHMLDGGAAVASAITPVGLVLVLPGVAPDPDVSVVSLEFANPIQIDRAPTSSGQSGQMGTPLDPSGATAPK